jgi:Sulfotransferase family
MTAAAEVRQPTFDVDSLAEAARERVGAGPDAPVHFRDALQRLASALDLEARLTPSGRVAVRNALIGALCVQLRVDRSYAAHPEIARVAIERPIFVIGLLRTGSTLVHNLLGVHPDLRAPVLWELMNPAGDDNSVAEQQRLAQATQDYVNEYYGVAPRLPSVHFLDARRPDECHRLTGNAFQTMVYEARYRIPSYSRWLAGHDRTESYAYHRVQMRAILWRRPGAPLVGKDPFHLWSLGPLNAAYPDARYVHLHRDPAETVPSSCSLCAVLRGARSDVVDAAELGQQWLWQIERVMPLIAAGRAGPLACRPVLDVRYRDLMRDTIGTMGQICDFLEVPLTGAAERRMRAYLAENAQHKHGSHRYTAEQFGLSTADLAGRFAEYRETYRV